jgi:argininosuccinate lyase
MPQKKNPDVLELIRGKAARVMADVSQLLILIKGLPMAYNRDLQEDKLALFDAFDTVEACLEVAPALIAGAELQVDRINEKIDEGFLDATALMEYLIKRGVPMRTGHGTVGKLIDESVYNVLGTHNAVAALQSYGSGGKAPVEEQIAFWQGRLSQQ